MADNDRGSVQVLGIGVIVVLAMVLLAGVDLTRLALARRDADATAAAAARAGAQALDLATYYETGSGDAHPGRFAVDPQQARVRVREFLALRHDWHLVDMSVSDDRLTVQVSGRVALTTAGLVGRESVAVSGAAATELRLVPG